MGKRGITFKDDMIEEMLSRMRTGETLTSIAADVRMPSIDTMNRWEEDQDSDLGAAITRARAQGYTVRAEKAVTTAQTADDPAKGRLAFDAERWFLGKMHPKKFGEAVQLRHADADGNRRAIDDLELATRIASLANTIKGEDATSDESG